MAIRYPSSDTGQWPAAGSTGNPHQDPGEFAFQRVGICAAVLVLCSIQGCATLSEADCLSADWAVMGEVDGQQGRPLSDLNRYRRQCAEYGVTPDSEAYTQARERGLTVFCTEPNGYNEGRSGTQDRVVCPAALQRDFQAGHALGRAVHTSLEALRSSGDSIVRARSEIDDLRTRIDERESSLRSDELDEDERRSRRDDIDSMNARIDELEDDVVVSAATLGIGIAVYRSAVAAARSAGHAEPMEAELLRELTRLTQ